MHPYLHLGPITFPSYLLMAIIGIIAFLIWSFVILRRVEREDPAVIKRAFLLAVPAFLCLVVAAFLLNSFFHSIKYGEIFFGGITWEGGVIGAFVSYPLLVHYFLREKKGDALHFFSHLVPGIVLGHAFGRVGCFFGGCCYGTITDSPLGVSFPAGSPAATEFYNAAAGGASFPVWPTQLFEAVFEVLLFLIMLLLYRKAKDILMEVYLLSYGTFRFFLEFLRGDDRGSTGFFLSPSQCMSILLVIAGVLLLLYERGIIGKKIAKRAEKWRAEARLPIKVRTPEEIYESIERLHTLVESGALTEEEFTEKKAELLRRL